MRRRRNGALAGDLRAAFHLRQRRTELAATFLAAKTNWLRIKAHGAIVDSNPIAFGTLQAGTQTILLQFYFEASVIISRALNGCHGSPYFLAGSSFQRAQYARHQAVSQAKVPHSWYVMRAWDAQHSIMSRQIRQNDVGRPIGQ